MSFDLKLLGGDIVVDPSGDVNLVSEWELAKQQLFNSLVTPIGTNLYHEGYGSLLPYLSNNVISFSEIERDIKSSVQNTVNSLIALQKYQRNYQFLSPQETIVSINSIDVQIDSDDPRLINIYLSILNGSSEVLYESVTIRL